MANDAGIAGDAGNTYQTARVLSRLPTSFSGTLEPRGFLDDDTDWYSFTLTQTQTVTINIFSTFSNFEPLLQAALFKSNDSDQNFIGYAIVGTAFSLDHVQLSSGTYFLNITGLQDFWPNSFTVPYSISIDTTAPPSDTTPPHLASTSPSDNETGVALNANVTLSFDEAVQAGTGSIEIRRSSDGGLAASIAVTDTNQVTFFNNQVTINPINDLAANTGYYVTLGSGVIKDLFGNNYAGISSTTAFNFTTVAGPTPLPDLDATTLSLSSTSLTAGGSTTVSYTVTNLGTAPAPPSEVGFYRSTDAFFDSSDTLLATRSIGQLAPLTSWSEFFSLPLATAGTYNIIAVADHNRIINNEISESNNPSNAVQVTVTAPPTQRPDLTASLVSISDTTPAARQTLSFTYEFHNIGSVAAGNFYTGLYLSLDPTISPDDTLLRWELFGSLAAGSTVATTQVATMPNWLRAGTTYYVGVIADVFVDQVVEANESNNASLPLAVTVPNNPPVITSNGGGLAATVFMPESSAVVTQVVGFDPDPNTTLTYQVIAGADADKFQINATTGVLSFIAAPNFETPADGNGDNSYVVQVRAFDGSLSGIQTLTVNVTDATEPSDFNGDGRSDLLWQKADGSAAVWLMNGLGLTAGANVGFNPGSNWHVVNSGDFNGDRKADILWQNQDGTPAVWLMNGLNLLAGGNVGFNPGKAWHVVDSGDFNGDGKADILWQNQDGTPAVWLMNGLTLLAGANVGFNPGTAWKAISAGDFNGDGRDDILWQNDNGTAAVWLMNGLGLVSGGNVGFNPGNSWNVQDAGDFNGDGRDDILWQNDNGAPAIWLMNGLALATGASVGFNPGTGWDVQSAEDLNGDGRADIVWQNDNGAPAVWLMNGLGLLAGAAIGFNPGSAWEVLPQHHELA